jgi:NitT/TauT family transport system substrate-binding protein
MMRSTQSKGEKKMEKNQAIALAIVVIVGVSIVGVALWFPPSQPDVRIGYLSADLHQLAVWVAYQRGFFDDENITVELNIYQNGGYAMDGFQAGQIDMAYLGAAPALVKRLNQGIGVTILAAANLEGSAINVLKSEYDAGRITSIADLVGKTVYHPGPPTVQNFLLRLALEQSGLTIANITPETARVQDMDALLTPDSPAFIAWEPFPSLSEYENRTVPLILSGEIWPGHPCCVVASSNSFLDTNPDVVQKVINAHQRAEIWINENPAEALQLAAQWLLREDNPEPVETAFNRIIYTPDLNRTGLELYLEFLIDQDLITDPPTDIDAFFDGFIDTTFINNAPYD